MDNMIITSNNRMWTAKDVRRLLQQSYWADKRPIEVIERSMDYSICYGVIENDSLIGLGRVVTDHATIFWICDIIVDEAHRGKGIGKKIMTAIMEDVGGSDRLGILCTKDAHGLYEQFGFQVESKKAMTRKRA